jgi:hypothetical protein
MTPVSFADLRRNYEQLKADWISVKQTLSLAAALPKFFREPITLGRAEEEIKRLLDSRAKSSLSNWSGGVFTSARPVHISRF